MQSWDDRQLEELRSRWPDWDIWFVRYPVARRVEWCARPKGQPLATINRDDLDDFLEALGRATLAMKGLR